MCVEPRLVSAGGPLPAVWALGLLLSRESRSHVRSGTRSTIRASYARGTADDNALAIFKAANGARGSSFLDPDTVVIHPTNWQAIRTAAPLTEAGEATAG